MRRSHYRAGPRPGEHTVMHRLFAIALFACAACSGSRAAPAQGPEAAVPVRTAAVERGPMARPVRAAGKVAARDERELSFKVGGIVARVEARQGVEVRR